MPSDSVIGTCGSSDILADYEESEAFWEALHSLDFAYAGTSGCCHLYESTGTETPCGETGYTVLSDSPFKFVFDGAYLQTDLVFGNHSTDDGLNSGCCEGDYLTMPCLDARGGSIQISDGTAWMPGSLYVKGTLQICITASQVTIAINLTFLADYAVMSAVGNVTWLNTGRHHITCVDGVWSASGVGTPDEGCAKTVGGVLLTDAQDVSAGPGATIWEKIKAATWSSGYEYAICGIGGGCGVEVHETTGPCIINSGCHADRDGDPMLIDEYNWPYNQDCYYSVGTVGFAFT